jgi:hypothetical protein
MWRTDNGLEGATNLGERGETAVLGCLCGLLASSETVNNAGGSIAQVGSGRAALPNEIARAEVLSLRGRDCWPGQLATVSSININRIT